MFCMTQHVGPETTFYYYLNLYYLTVLTTCIEGCDLITLFWRQGVNVTLLRRFAVIAAPAL